MGKRDNELCRETVLNIFRAESRFRREVQKLFKEYGASQPQLNVLRILRESEGGALPSGGIGEKLWTNVPDITRLVDRLEESGFVVRNRVPEDRRVVMVQITQKGRALVKKVAGPLRALSVQQLSHLSIREVETLSRLLRKGVEE